MRILVATRNPGKVKELRGLLAELGEGVTLVGLDETLPDVVEDEATFEGNAIKKAREYAAMTGLATLADDSGLEVDALDGAPGIFSARYAGVHGDDAANNRLLLERLQEVDDDRRTARFVCALALAHANEVYVVRGEIEGQILREARGTRGFGYDPLFYVDSLGQTTAEMSPDTKNRVSHRGAAVQRMLPHLREHLTAPL